MELNIIDSHIVTHWPLLKRYTVFFREGGVQNFISEIDDLPPTLQKYIGECEEHGWFEVHEFGFVPHAKVGPEDVRSDLPFSVTLYSRSFGKRDEEQKE